MLRRVSRDAMRGAPYAPRKARARWCRGGTAAVAVRRRRVNRRRGAYAGRHVRHQHRDRGVALRAADRLSPLLRAGRV